MTIRPYEPADFSHVVELLRVLQQHFAALDPLHEVICSNDFGPEELRSYLADVEKHTGTLLVSEEGGTVTGFIQGVIWEQDDPTYLRSHSHVSKDGWVGLLVVDPDSRGSGIGAALLAAIEDYFANQGCTSVKMKVAADNVGARAFYTHHKYVDRDIEIMKPLIKK